MTVKNNSNLLKFNNEIARTIVEHNAMKELKNFGDFIKFKPMNAKEIKTFFLHCGHFLKSR